MAIDLDDIKRLIDLAAGSGVATLDVTVSGMRVRIETGHGAASAPPPAIPLAAAPAPMPAAAPEPEPSNAVRAPTDGLIHLAPSPGAPRFVAEGQGVQAGDTLCLIEVMKMFHPITAPAAGTVRSIRVEDGQQVNFDEVLLEFA